MKKMPTAKAAPQFVVTDENYPEMLDQYQSMPQDTPEWEALGDAIGEWSLG